MDGSYIVPLYAPNLFALVSDETRRIWVSTQGWKPAVSSIYYGFISMTRFNSGFKLKPGLKPNLKSDQINWVSIVSHQNPKSPKLSKSSMECSNLIQHEILARFSKETLFTYT